MEAFRENLGQQEIKGANMPHEGNSWSDPGNFPEFAGDKPKLSNIQKLQNLLDRTGFSELRKDPNEFSAFLRNTDKQDLYRYLQHINQNLREATVQDRGFHDGRMFVSELISPDRAVQTEILSETIDAITDIKDDKYRAALAYYQTNSLHLFPDANGRTSRALYMILRRPDFNLKDSEEYITHSNNKSQSENSNRKTSQFESLNGLSYPKEFTQYSMLETIKSIEKEDAGFGASLEPFRRSFEMLMGQEPRNRTNVVIVMGAAVGAEASEGNLYALRKNPAYQALSDQDRERFNYAICDNAAAISVAGLAMLEFHHEKGDLQTFLQKYTKELPRYSGFSRCVANIDPDDENFFGGCECQDWSAEDLLRYTDIAEGIKKRQLETGIDIFLHPELHTTQSGEKIADVLAR